jgi:hypothetical protein
MTPANPHSTAREDEDPPPAAMTWQEELRAIQQLLRAHPEWEATVTTRASGTELECLAQYMAEAKAALEALFQPGARA